MLINVHGIESTKKRLELMLSANSISKNRGFLKQCSSMLVNFLQTPGLVLRYIDWLKKGKKEKHLLHKYYLHAFLFQEIPSFISHFN